MDAKLKLHIRWMIRRDMPEVVAIEEDSFEFPWTEADFLLCLRQRNCIGMVVEDVRASSGTIEGSGPLVGFMVYELYRATIHVLAFAVHPAYRRRGVGSAMAAKLKEKIRYNRVQCELRETNLVGQLFFQAQGFRAVSVLRDFYEDTSEDAYLMRYRQKPDNQAVPSLERI